MPKPQVPNSKKLIPVSVSGFRNIPGCGTDLIRCVRCGIPETYETVEFDGQGVCSICMQSDFKANEIDWNSRKLDLDSIIERYRGCLLYTSPSPRDRQKSRMPSSA